ncbi:ACP S-malonyltransferase [Candidatus Fermentibacteria bacterium]|nr:ACP S-malonyltransferase [Candidatus Fermentibacteria bacterium]
MPKIAFLFPGQASQSVGMDEHLDAYPEAVEVLDNLSQLQTDEDLRELISNGPEDLLTRTDNVQPAIAAVSLATLAVLERAGVVPQGAAGHSLGEYSALVAAEVIDVDRALRLTRVRGELMQRCADRHPGGMLALLGMEVERVRECLEDASRLGPVGIANVNSSGQVVVSGAREALDRAKELCKESGAKRIIPLKVSGAWHSPLMEDAAEGLWSALVETRFDDPDLPVLANVTADYLVSGDESRILLRKQVVSPVMWAATMDRMIDDGYDTFVEVGPGRVLQGLLRRREDISLYGTQDADALTRTVTNLGTGER